MIDNRVLTPDEWQCVLYAIATILFVLGLLFKRLSDDLHKKLEVLQREHGWLKSCPFCGSIPDVKNGCFLCKKCKLTMNIPFRKYKSVEDMVNQTWNKRWKDGK
jgi:hypothetical protein